MKLTPYNWLFRPALKERRQNEEANITFQHIANGGVGVGAVAVAGVAGAGGTVAAGEGVVGGGGDVASNVGGAAAVGVAGVVPAILGASKFHKYSAN